MPALSNMVRHATHRVLLYGPPKSGKTELAGKLSEHFNLLWFDCEQGWVTLTKLPSTQQDKINIISIPDSRVYPIAAETWLKVIKGLPVNICNEHGKVDCALCKKASAPFEHVHLNETKPDTIVVFDSLTQFSNSCLAHITKNQPDDYKPQLDDWGNLRVLIDKFLSQVQAAPYNVICITHEEQAQMEDGRVKLVPVSGSSKSSMYTAKYFDHVIYCEIKNKKHIASASTTYANNITTGSRTDAAVDDNGMPSLLNIFRPTTTQENKPAQPVVQPVVQTTQGENNAQPKTAAQQAIERLRAAKASAGSK